MIRNGLAPVRRGCSWRSVRLARIGKWALIGALAGGAGQTTLAAQGPPPEPQLIVGRNSNMLGGDQILRLNPFEVRGDVLGRADNEPSCAISTRNPDHIICGANTYRMVDVPGISATSETRDAWQGVYQSVTGGETWESTLHPGFFLDPQPHVLKALGFRAAADPTVRSGPAGLAFYSGIAFKRDKSVNSLYVTTFADLNNRENDTMPFKVVRTTIVDLRLAPKFIDKPWIHVEAAPAGQTCRMIVRTDSEGTPSWASTWWGQLVSNWLAKRWPGWTPKTFVTQEVPASIIHVVYSIFQDLEESKADLMYSQSTNCGATFSLPKKLSAVAEPANGGAIAKAAVNGSQRVFAAWRRVKVDPAPAPHAVLAVVSNNNGRTWSLPKTVAEICPFEQGTTVNSFRTTAFPTMTADATGRAYLAWSDRGRQQNGTCNPFGAGRIMISTSTDGVNWSPPYAAVPSATGEHQVMPSLAFTAGKLFLAWVDFSQDVSGVFGQYVDEANLFVAGNPVNPPAKRHTADVRAAMADPVATPDFSADVARVSKYLMGRTPSIVPDIPGQPVQLQWNAVNRRWARKMTVPFDGDYIDIATRPFLPPDSTANPPRLNWTPNNGVVPTTPTVLMAWTDNRDMRDVRPSQLNPDGSVPFAVPANVPGVLELGSGASIVDPTQSRQMCVPGQVFKTGTTNQNIYAARALAGFAASSPSGNKALGAVTRSFVVFVRNDTEFARTFRLQIANQPAGGVASFDQFNPNQTIVEPIIIARFSSIARTVFVSKDATPTALDPKATVRVDVTELAGGAAVSTEAILLNGDRSAPEIDSPEIDSREIYLPEIDSPEIDSVGVSGPEIDSPEIDSPEIDSEMLKALGLGSPEIDSPEIDSPEIDSPEIDSPEIDSPEIDSAPITDIKFRVTNKGNTTAQYNAKSLIKGASGGAFNYQIIVRRKYALRAVNLNCEPATVSVSKVLVNALNVNPQSPEIDSPEIDSSAPGTASFSIPPGMTVEVIVRRRKLIESAPDPLPDSVGLATQQDAVNTDDAAAGITEAPVVTSFLSVSTTVLPAGVTGTPYSRQLEASGGQTPFFWNTTSGLLPPGLTLSAAGLVAGTPTTAGTYPFVVEVRDSSAPQEVATRALSITITQAGAASLAFVTQPSAVVFGQPIDPPVSVRALNANGSFAAGVTISIAIGSNTGGGTLSGTLSAVTGASGIAVFTTLSIDQTGSYTLVASTAGFPSATSLAFTVTAAVGSGLAVFDNRIAFLTATGATNATGPLPGLGSVNGGATVGTATFDLAPGGDTLDIGGAIDWYPGLAGNDIALGYENLQVSFVSPVSAMGFVLVEPAATLPPHGGSPVDSLYLVTLFNGTVEVGRFSFNAPDDQIAFVGVSSVTPFTRATIVDTTGNDDDEYFGEFYTSSGGGVAYVVTNTNDSGAGSLRQAILDANATPSADSVIFDIPGVGPTRTILSSALPSIVAAGGPISIDGTTQPGFAGVPIIEIDGTTAGSVAGLNISAGSSSVRGLMINSFGQNGIAVSGSGNNTIIGNWIGLAPTGLTAKPNGANGVHIVDSPANTMGGATPLAVNVVSGNAGEGVRIDGTLATGNVVTGNFIGTTATGAGPLGNLASGVFIRRAPGNSVIGNTVSYNTGFAGVAICGNQGGFCGGSDIGTQSNNANGNAVDGNVINNNAGRGLSLDGVANTLVGTVAGNNISGNGVNGVMIFGVGATGNELASNAINSNSGDGVQIVGAGNTGNLVQGNSFVTNTDLAIDLAGDGVTANDSQDADSGPNHLQNSPVITGASTTTVSGTLHSAPNTTFSVQLYESIVACGASGQGDTLVATFNVGTNGIGDEPFGYSGLSLTAGRYITATATDPSGNTSEFSACAEVMATNPLIVTNTNDSGSGSLRNAITYANTTPGTQTISFNIGGASPASPAIITPLTSLPSITGGVVIDGTSDPGYDGRPVIEVSGASAPGHGFLIATNVPNVTIRGLAITRFTANGIYALQDDQPGDTGGHHLYESNYVGTNRFNAAGLGNANGIVVRADNSSIRTSVISGNTFQGVRLENDADNVVIELNRIGTTDDGLGPLGNGTGIAMFDTLNNNLIENNTISANTGLGVNIQRSGAGPVVNTRIRGNRIGVSASGGALGNVGTGVRIDRATGTIVGEPGNGNVISGNNGPSAHGILIAANTVGTTIQANKIGTDDTGTVAIPNGPPAGDNAAVFVDFGASNVVIGGSVLAGQGNVISGNSAYGVKLWGHDNQVNGNLIGTDGSGTTALPNVKYGVHVERGANNAIGAAGGFHNVVSGNGLAGIVVSGAGLYAGATGTLIYGNAVGVGSDFNTSVANDGAGVDLREGTSTEVAGNTIRGNAGAGVAVWQGTTGNLIATNTIYGNGGLGIDIDNDGPTANDAGDGDPGPNNRQNFPVLSTAVNNGPTTSVDYDTTSFGAGLYVLRFYANTSCDASGFGEGEQFVGLVTVANGVTGTASLTQLVPVGRVITATATGGFETSEFSACTPVAGPPDLVSAVGELSPTVSPTAVTFRVRFAPGTFSATTTLIQILMDTDENVSTGHPGTDGACTNDATVLGADYIARAGAGGANVAPSPACNAGGASQAATLVTLPDGMDVTFPLSAIGGDDGQLRFKVITYTWLSPVSTTGIQDRLTGIGQAALVVP